MKRTEIIIIAVLALCIGTILWHRPFAESCTVIRAGTLRLHVVANSDSEADQAVKLAVRDAVLERTAVLANGAVSRDELAAQLAQMLPEIEQTARETLAAAGFDYEPRAYLCDMYFDTMTYGEATLPAGIYRALRIELGEAGGKNWWCVMYPSLCVMAAGGEQSAVVGEVFDEAESEIILGGERFRVQFLLEEWLCRLQGDARQNERAE